MRRNESEKVEKIDQWPAADDSRCVRATRAKGKKGARGRRPRGKLAGAAKIRALQQVGAGNFLTNFAQFQRRLNCVRAIDFVAVCCLLLGGGGGGTLIGTRRASKSASNFARKSRLAFQSS